MLPPPEALPDVLPTDRLTASGKPVPEVREELRRIPDARNVVTVVLALVQTFGVVLAAHRLHHPAAYVAAFLLMGRGHCLLAILGHESAHRLLFSSKAVNDAVGRWVIGYPTFLAVDLYRRAHMAHHRDEFGPEEPDLQLYDGYPLPVSSLRRKLLRDAFFVSGWKNLRPLLGALGKPTARPLAARILGVQVVIAAGLTLAGTWWLYPALWLAPWMTVWRVLNRLRAIAEHGGMTRSKDRRLTTHVVRQRPLARFWMVPYNTGWHLAHHVDIGIPFRKLPAFHRELVVAGWVTEDLEYPSYRALWKALASAPEPAPGAPDASRLATA
jgi:fatty acid desaturase